MKYFEHKTIWITGASSGIGEGLVKQLSQYDCKLLISARRLKELERVKSECARGAAQIACLTLDLAQAETIAARVEEAKRLFGDIDILINNGGISQRDTAINTSMDVHRRLMEVNYFGTISLTSVLLPDMVNRKSGHIVVITSTVGILSTPKRSGYAASKHALHGYFDALRAEHHDDHVKVTLICPGWINTNLSLFALKGDGSTQNFKDDTHKKGMTVDVFSRKAIRVIAKQKQLAYIGGFLEVFGIYMKRLFPWLTSIIIRKIKVT